MQDKFIIFFDPQSCAIQGISPIDLGEHPGCEQLIVDAEQAHRFLTGEYSIHEWLVSQGPKGHVLTDNPLMLEPLDVGEFVSVPVLPYDPAFQGVTVQIFRASSLAEVSIPRKYHGSTLTGRDTEMLDFSITKKGGEELLSSWQVDLKELMARGSIQTAIDLKGITAGSDFQVYTTRVFWKYRLEVFKGTWKASRDASVKANNLVLYQTPEQEPLEGVLATYSSKKRTLTLTTLDDTALVPDGSMGVIFFTKPLDPTIVLHSLEFDVQKLSREKTMEFDIPRTVPPKFSLAGSPIGELLWFVKK